MIDLNNLSLEIDISNTEAPGYNLLPNPSSERGAYAWGDLSTNQYGNLPVFYNLPEEAELLRRVGGDNLTAPANWAHRYNGQESFAMSGNALAHSSYYYVVSNPVKVIPGRWVRAAIRETYSADASGNITVGVSFDGGAITWGTQRNFTTLAVFENVNTAIVVPSGTQTARVHIRVGVVPKNVIFFAKISLNQATTAALANGAGYEERAWTNILSPTSYIEVNRAELEVGTLQARVHDSSVDPAKVSHVRPGRDIRLRGLVSGVWDTVFFGRIYRAQTQYKKNRKPDITLLAVDSVYTAANTKRQEGFKTLDELSYIINNAGIPYIVNGDSSFEGNPPWEVVTTLPDATVLDHITLVRDTHKAYVWGDRYGVMNVWDTNKAPLGKNPIWLSDEQPPSENNVQNNAVNPRATSGIGADWTVNQRTAGSTQLEMVHVDQAFPAPWKGVIIKTTAPITAGNTYVITLHPPRTANPLARIEPGITTAGKRYKHLLVDYGIRCGQFWSGAGGATMTINMPQITAFNSLNWKQVQMGYFSSLAWLMQPERLVFDENQRSSFNPPGGPSGATAYDAHWEFPMAEIRLEFSGIDAPAGAQLCWLEDFTVFFKDSVQSGSSTTHPSTRTALEIPQPFTGESAYSSWAGVRDLTASIRGPQNYVAMSGVDKGYDTDGVINTVVVNTLKDEEVWVEIEGKTPFWATQNTKTAHGPYTSNASVETYGVQKYEVDVLEDVVVDPGFWASGILQSYANPVVTVRGATWPVKNAASFAKAVRADLYDGVNVVFEGQSTSQLRITRLRHKISPEKWVVDFEFNKRRDSTLW